MADFCVTGEKKIAHEIFMAVRAVRNFMHEIFMHKNI